MSDEQRVCSKCKAPMHAEQDWCLQCGRGAPKSLRTGPGWRAAAAALGGSAVLALGAAAAAYAAFQSEPTHPSAPATVAQTPPVTTTTPGGTQGTPGTEPPPAGTGGAGSGGSGGSGAGGTLPGSNSKPPKIPGGSTGTPNKGEEELPFGEEEEFPFEEEKGGKGKGKKSGEKGGGQKSSGGGTNIRSEEKEEEEESTQSGNEEESGQPSNGHPAVARTPLVLDTNAAGVYNPRHYPGSLISDPSRAIDGDVATSWTVKVRSETAPKVGVGIVLNLKSLQRIAKVAVIAPAPSMTVQIYGTTDRRLPHKLHSKQWVKLSPPHRITKENAAIYLNHSRRSFRQLLVWLIESPASRSSTQAKTSSASLSLSSSSTTSTAALPATATDAALGTISTSSTSSSTTSSASSTTQQQSSPGGNGSSGEPSSEEEGPLRKVKISEIELYAPKASS